MKLQDLEHFGDLTLYQASEVEGEGGYGHHGHYKFHKLDEVLEIVERLKGLISHKNNDGVARVAVPVTGSASSTALSLFEGEEF